MTKIRDSKTANIQDNMQDETTENTTVKSTIGGVEIKEVHHNEIFKKLQKFVNDNIASELRMKDEIEHNDFLITTLDGVATKLLPYEQKITYNYKCPVFGLRALCLKYIAYENLVNYQCLPDNFDKFCYDFFVPPCYRLTILNTDEVLLSRKAMLECEEQGLNKHMLGFIRVDFNYYNVNTIYTKVYAFVIDPDEDKKILKILDPLETSRYNTEKFQLHKESQDKK